MLKAQSIFQKDTMSRLAELRHESDQISARTKAMLEQFPGNKWGGTQESEWAGLMARAGEVHAESGLAGSSGDVHRDDGLADRRAGAEYSELAGS